MSYTTEDFLKRDERKLAQVNQAMQSLSSDHRKCAMDLYKKFAELKEILEDNIESYRFQIRTDRMLELTGSIL